MSDLAPHVMPVDDICRHDSSPGCICGPSYSDGVWVHHSLDGREVHEEAGDGDS